MKKLLALLLVAAMTFSMVACGTKKDDTPVTTGDKATETEKKDDTPKAEEPVDTTEAFSIAMVTDVGGVNDQSFNQSAWEGLLQAEKEYGAKVKYLESKQEADYGPNLDKMSDEEQDIIWGVGFMMGDAIANAANMNSDRLFAIVDYAYGPEAPANTIGVVFRAQEPSFLVGYIAAKMTKTDKLGFIGGIKGEVIDQFEYGYRSGVAYAAKELGKEITVEVQYADDFGDAAKGKSIATKMYTNGVDIIFSAAGNVGNGAIEAAKEMNKYAIGVDRDQNYLAPDHVITSAMKLVGQAMYLVSKDVKDGVDLGGKTLAYGIKEGAAGIAPTSDKLVPADILEATKAVEKEILEDKIVPAFNEETFNAYINALK